MFAFVVSENPIMQTLNTRIMTVEREMNQITVIIILEKSQT